MGDFFVDTDYEQSWTGCIKILENSQQDQGCFDPYSLYKTTLLFSFSSLQRACSVLTFLPLPSLGTSQRVLP